MNIDRIALEDTGYFKPLFLDYCRAHAPLRPFYSRKPVVGNFGGLLTGNRLGGDSRSLLVDELRRQYGDLGSGSAAQNNIDLLLKPNAYSVTTGHQLNILTGPLYVIYKLITTILTCRKLSENYPEAHFIPVYWMSSEDHDFEEISHFRLFSKEHIWKTQQQGPVGRYHLGGLEEVLDQMPVPVPLFSGAYGSSRSLAEAVRKYMHSLFGHHGLVVLDPDSSALKSSFLPIVIDDLRSHRSQALVQETSVKLEALGYKSQVHPRKINYFLIDDGMRRRLVEGEGGNYEALAGQEAYTYQELVEEITTNPARISPNVITRTLYQEWILPNICYVGGPAEVAYWLQYKTLFAHYGIPYPVLLPRNFATLISTSEHNRLGKLGLAPSQIFRSTAQIIADYVSAREGSRKDPALPIGTLSETFDAIAEEIRGWEPSLEGMVRSLRRETFKKIEGIKKKALKSQKQKYDQQLRQIESIKERLFPGNSLQEREDNFLNFFAGDPSSLDGLMEVFDPFRFEMNILSGL